MLIRNQVRRGIAAFRRALSPYIFMPQHFRRCRKVRLTRELFRRSVYWGSAGITEVYVNATLVYMHVVLSGAHPEVLDIRKAVDSTITAIKTLAHAKLVRRLAWPICVAASVAESRHEEFFNKLEQGMRGDQDGSVSVLRALAVARECQRLRQENLNSTATFDWIDELESLGEQWILL
jgi:hypothetical protein